MCANSYGKYLATQWIRHHLLLKSLSLSGKNRPLDPEELDFLDGMLQQEREKDRQWSQQQREELYAFRQVRFCGLEWLLFSTPVLFANARCFQQESWNTRLQLMGDATTWSMHQSCVTVVRRVPVASKSQGWHSCVKAQERAATISWGIQSQCS